MTIQTSPTPVVKSSEQPLGVFVSSVMSPDMKWARDAVAATLDRVPYLSRWLFEYTPASSDTADNSYLSKVREADVVIWLVADKTTEPVQNELREALASERRLWIFKLPAPSRDQATEALVKEVGLKAKWIELKEQAQFAELLDLTLGDEVVRAMRNKPGMGRLAHLEELGRASRARCIARWQALGLSRAEASTLADDASVGDPATTLDGAAKPPVCVVSGDFGSGKSLVAERLLQRAILNARDNAGAPVPIFLRAGDALGKLKIQTEALSNGLGDPRKQGACIVIDGADEVGIDAAAELLGEARVLASTWPQTSIVITSRPMGFSVGKDEIARVRPLSEEESDAIIERIAGERVTPGGRANWSDPIRSSVSRPLFAVLLAIDLRERTHLSAKSLGEMLGWMVERALGKQKSLAKDLDHILQKLALLSTDRKNSPAPSGEVVSSDLLPGLVDSRLVVLNNGLLSFPLPILAQWFAARAVLSGSVSVEALADNPRRLEVWYYPLIVAVGMASNEEATQLLVPIATKNPALAAMICEEALAQWGMANDVMPPPVQDSGGRIRTAMQAWIAGIGPLAKLIAPLRADGSLRPIGLAVSNAWLYASWYAGTDAIADVVELPPSVHPMGDFEPGWRSLRGARPGRQPNWAWRWTLEELRLKLSKLIDQQNLPLEDGLLYQEKMWNTGLLLAGKGNLHYDPLPLDKIEKKLSELAAHGPRINYNGRDLNLDEIKRYLDTLKKKELPSMMCPYPGPDRQRGRWIWSGYSEEQIRTRAKAVYEAALQGYSQLVAAWLPRLAPRLELAAMLPVRAVGTIRVEHDAPRMTFYFEPLPRGSASEIRFSLGQDRASDKQQYEEWQKILRTAHALRPEIAEWCNYSFGGGGITDVFHSDAATRLAYGWLKDDLRRIKWVG